MSPQSNRITEGKWRKWLRYCRAAVSVGSPGFSRACTNGQGWSNYGQMKLERKYVDLQGMCYEILDVAGNMKHRSWMWEYTWRGGVTARFSHERPGNWVQMPRIKLSSFFWSAAASRSVSERWNCFVWSWDNKNLNFVFNNRVVPAEVDDSSICQFFRSCKSLTWKFMNENISGDY